MLKLIKINKEYYYLMINGLIHPENITIVNMHTT